MDIKYLPNTFLFNDLIRNTKIEKLYKDTRKPSIANTYQNEPQFQQTENLSRNYMRTGNQKFADPFQFNSRPYYDEYDGRNLKILNTLKINANKDRPDIITLNPLKNIGFY